MHKAPEILLTHTENLGCGGMRLLIEKEIVVAQAVQVELFIGKKKKITARAKVVWSMAIKNPCDQKTVLFDIGLEFIGITDAYKAEIERLVYALMDKNHA